MILALWVFVRKTRGLIDLGQGFGECPLGWRICKDMGLDSVIGENLFAKADRGTLATAARRSNNENVDVGIDWIETVVEPTLTLEGSAETKDSAPDPKVSR
jgi:hypothetical protein